ncbi:type I restriction endonuclease subunit M [Caenimonas aquaedulcis]|uniref:Type I restriction endonuclease subunit M n=1 Tax=Caenimonas aquaedulcis TaxID=2793270 RepID=A0A931H4C3_9BURK|nr:type I restriction endonuclease subunit M [Caenimonas aquaedulcis]MBG9388386.1 type I restriction endonuclease subunit M [Caenimonas aquaedulcis]
MVTPAFRIILLNVKPLFELGQILVTPNAARLIATHRTRVEVLLARHVTADWGDVTAVADIANRLALQSGGELMSIYKLKTESEVLPTATHQLNPQLWVVTEANRETTTFLTPGDY